MSTCSLACERCCSKRSSLAITFVSGAQAHEVSAALQAQGAVLAAIVSLSKSEWCRSLRGGAAAVQQSRSA